MKNIFACLVFAFAVCAGFASPPKMVVVERAVPKADTYVLHIGDYDWGAGFEKFVVQTKKEVEAGRVRAEDFEIDVYVKIKAMRLFPVRHKKPKVGAAYLCDENGNRVDDERGRFVAVEIVASEKDGDSHVFNNTIIADLDEIGNIHIENDELDIEIEDCSGLVNKRASVFSIDERFYRVRSRTEKMKFAYFLPEAARGQEGVGENGAMADAGALGKEGAGDEAGSRAEKKIPLIVWFHAVGEGGTNPYRPLLEQRAVNLAAESVQGHFEDGVAVLVPLCETAWLRPLKDKDTKKRGSYYTMPAADLIDEFVAAHPIIDENRIYVGGASAGGFMALNMALNFPEKIAACFTASHAFSDKNLEDADIAALSRVPMWFVVCDKDKTVAPEKFAAPTYGRLKAAAADVRLTRYASVEIDGVEYDGHSAWIYVLNDLVEENGLKLFDWLASQRLRREVIAAVGTEGVAK